MELWKLWLAGLVVVVITNRIIYKQTQVPKWLLWLFITVSVVIVGGIPIGSITGEFFSLIIASQWHDWLIPCVLAMIPFGLVYIVGCFTLGIDMLGIKAAIKCFVLLLISTICWTFLYKNYYANYNANIEYRNETIVIYEEEKELLYFANIPVQEISGSISGSSFIGTGHVSGKINTSNELSYWYLNEKDEGLYNSVPTSASRIIFIEDGEKPRVKITGKREQKIKMDHNTEEETVTINSEWEEYIFYLPKEIMQYNLE